MAVRDQKIARKKIAIVAKWRASGLSQAEFCRQEGLAQWQLSEWKRFAQNRGSKAAVKPVSDRRKPGPRGEGVSPHNSRSGRTQPESARVEQQTFVPVTLVDDTDIVAGAADVLKDFDCVLEIVLPGRRTFRVAPHCRPEFLGAAVSALETC